MAKDKASQDEIYRTIRREIESGVYPASSRLPSVRTLAKRFQASPNTISKVVSRLMESGMCSARRGVGLFVRSLPSRKLTILVGSKSDQADNSFLGSVETMLGERFGAEGIEVERYHITGDDPPFGPAIERVRRPGRVILGINLQHEPYLKTLAELRRPTLILGHAPSRSTMSSIVPNSFRSGYLAARHLIRSGRRRILFVGRIRRVRQVVLPEAESLKELAGVQCAFQEEGMNLPHEFVTKDIDSAIEMVQDNADLKPDAVIMPQVGEVEAAQLMKVLGKDVESVIIGDDRVLETQGQTAVVIDRQAFMTATYQELLRLLDEQRAQAKSYMIDTDLHA